MDFISMKELFRTFDFDTRQIVYCQCGLKQKLLLAIDQLSGIYVTYTVPGARIVKICLILYLIR